MKLKLLSISILFLFLNYSFVVSLNLTDSTKPSEINKPVINEAYGGYTLFAPEFSKNTYLIDNNGTILHRWRSRYRQGLPVYLLENGNLLRGGGAGIIRARFMSGGFTGKVEMFDWDGNVIWNYVIRDSRFCLHNDIEPLPNGNVLMILWEYKTREDAIEAGINPDFFHTYGGVLTDIIIEVEPVFPDKGNIVWEWHVWDHLIQDFDSSKQNFGTVSEHPELINMNYEGRTPIATISNYLQPLISVDLIHINALDYNEELDQIVFSTFFLNEICIIDHNLTTLEAEGHTAGRYGRGGDLLYRWGNPVNYERGNISDKKLFTPHDVQWIEKGCPGEGNLIVYNNGFARPQGNFSSIEELILPICSHGNYYLEENCSYGPTDPVWNYTSDPKTEMYSPIMSGVQRLPNGNTLICSGSQATFTEVNKEGETVW